MNSSALLQLLGMVMAGEDFPTEPVGTFDYTAEYKLIKQKKSKLSRKDRDRVIRKIEKELK